MRLKSRAGASGSARSPSHSASTDSSTPSRNSSTTTGASPKRCADEHVLERRPRLVLVGGDHDALARRQPVGLQRDRVAVIAARPASTSCDDRVGRRRHARGRHDLLRVGLGALELGGGGDRAERRDARLGAAVDEARDQRRLRPDDDEVDPGRGDRRGVVGAVERRRLARDPGVPGRAEHLRRLRRAQQRAHDRVLAPAAADDENPGQSAAMKSSIGIAIRVS